MDLKTAFGNFLKWLLKLIWRIIWKTTLYALWACLRATEFLARVLGDRVRSLVTPNDRPNETTRRNP